MLARSGGGDPPLLLYVDPETARGAAPAPDAPRQGVQPRLFDSPGAADRPGRPRRCANRSAKLPEDAAADDPRALDGDRSILAGKKVLIVDDDIRNIFALTSVLERYDMVTVSAETGRDAINLLQASPGRRHRADGHHDAGDGRHRHDAAPSARSRASRTCRSSP